MPDADQSFLETLHAREVQFRSLLENSVDVIYQFNLQAKRYEYVSPSVKQS